MTPYTHIPLTLARYLVDQADTPMSILHLHQLLYVTQAHALSLLGEPLYAEEAQAWNFGPVYPSLWKHLKCLGDVKLTHQHLQKHPCDKPLADIINLKVAIAFLERRPLIQDNLATLYSPKQYQLIDAVLNHYRSYLPEQLLAMNKAPHGPWHLARQHNPTSQKPTIPNSLIATYFKKALDLSRLEQRSLQLM